MCFQTNLKYHGAMQLTSLILLSPYETPADFKYYKRNVRLFNLFFIKKFSFKIMCYYYILMSLFTKITNHIKWSRIILKPIFSENKKKKKLKIQHFSNYELHNVRYSVVIIINSKIRWKQIKILRGSGL